MMGVNRGRGGEEQIRTCHKVNKGAAAWFFHLLCSWSRYLLRWLSISPFITNHRAGFPRMSPRHVKRDELKWETLH